MADLYLSVFMSTLTAASAIIIADLVIRWINGVLTRRRIIRNLLMEFEQNRGLLERSTWQPLIDDAWNDAKQYGMARKFKDSLRGDVSSLYSLILHRNHLLSLYNISLGRASEIRIQDAQKQESRPLSRIVADMRSEIEALMEKVEPVLKKLL